ncbi:MAG: DMT family transporter [Proteobacteria bacterium]|nr:DMT family transporter [Pseudomonadota bacterium]
MTHAPRRHLLGAFAAMLFVGASWGANVPVTKVLFRDYDVLPLIALRSVVAMLVVALLLAAVEGRRALRIDLGAGRFLLLGLMMGSFYVCYAIGLYYSNPITAATVQVAGPLVSATTVRAVTGVRFDRGFGVALSLTMLGGLILSSSSLLGSHVTFGGGEIIVLLSNVLWTLYSLKAQEWFDRASQLHRTYVASLSAMGWLALMAVGLVIVGRSRSPFAVSDTWVWAQFLVVAVLASGLGGYFWNVGASRLGVAIASLWSNLVPFFAVLWAMAYGFTPNGYQIAGGLVALGGVVYMQWRKLQIMSPAPI